MAYLPDPDLREVNLRLLTGHPQLMEMTGRYLKAQTIAIAAHGAMNDPKKANEEWKQAEADFFGAAAIYRTASDALTVFLSSDLWPAYGDKVGRHLLRLCEAWERRPAASREATEKRVHKMHFVIASLPLAKPKDGFSARQLREKMLVQAMKETGWDPALDEIESRKEAVQRGGVRRAGSRADEPRPRSKTANTRSKRER